MSKTFEEWYPTVYNESVESSRKMPDGFTVEDIEEAYLAGQASLAAEMRETEKQATEMAWAIYADSMATLEVFNYAPDSWREWDGINRTTEQAIAFLLSRNLIEKHPERQWYRRITDRD